MASKTLRQLFGSGAHIAVAVIACLALGAGASYGAQPEDRERMVFFPTLAHASGDDSVWTMTIRGRVSIRATDSNRGSIALAGFAPFAGVENVADKVYRERAGHLLSDSKSGRAVAIRIGDRIESLGVSDGAGMFSRELRLSAEDAAKFAKGGLISFASTTDRRARGAITLLPRHGVTVISDVDDTIKVTQIWDHEATKRNTFRVAFREVDRMPDLYMKWQATLGPLVHFHVVSAGPWQFYEPLAEFTQGKGFPDFTWDLRTFRISRLDTLAQEVFAHEEQVRQHKIKTISELMNRYPERYFVLVGDSGEWDPEIYSHIASRREFRDRITAVMIRHVDNPRHVGDRYAGLFQGLPPEKLHIFRDSSELTHLDASDLLVADRAP